MLEISFSLSYSQFEDIKDYTRKKMWDMRAFIYGGVKNLLRPEFEILRGKFNEMRMVEGGIIT